MRILFATDGSEGSDIALDLLLALPHRPTDQFDVVSVPVHHYIGGAIEGTGAYVAELVDAEYATAQRAAADAAVRMKARGIDARTLVVEGLAPDAIIAAAKRLRSDLIVVGTRGLGRIASALLGSTARALARHSPVPVLVVRERREAPRRILVATDGSPDACTAIAAIAAMPIPDRAEVTLLNVVPEGKARTWPAGPLGDELRAVAEREERSAALEVLRSAAEQLPAHVSMRLEIDRGSAADRLIAFAGAMGADLIVLGSRGTTLSNGFLQGSTADRVLSGAHCAVLVARTPAPAERPTPDEEFVAATAG
ncbi:MAG: universal stress protein [Chloroflexi bacterium]|nr:universal stress protein [Chloroflexota bacterium]